MTGVLEVVKSIHRTKDLYLKFLIYMEGKNIIKVKSHEFDSNSINNTNYNSNVFVPAYDEREVTVKEWFQYIFC